MIDPEENNNQEEKKESNSEKDITIESGTPPGYEARGIAAEKLKAKDGNRHRTTTEE